MKLKLTPVPYLLFNGPVSGGRNATTTGPFMTIDQATQDVAETRGDVGMQAHEELHIAIWWIASLICIGVLCISGYLMHNPLLYWFSPLGLFIDPALYAWCRPYRQWQEVVCYRKQLTLPIAAGSQVDWYQQKYAEFISTLYDLNISVEDARKLLT